MVTIVRGARAPLGRAEAQKFAVADASALPTVICGMCSTHYVQLCAKPLTGWLQHADKCYFELCSLISALMLGQYIMILGNWPVASYLPQPDQRLQDRFLCDAEK